MLPVLGHPQTAQGLVTGWRDSQDSASSQAHGGDLLHERGTKAETAEGKGMRGKVWKKPGASFWASLPMELPGQASSFEQSVVTCIESLSMRGAH